MLSVSIELSLRPQLRLCTSPEKMGHTVMIDMMKMMMIAGLNNETSEFVSHFHDMPPRCNIKKLVTERLRHGGTSMLLIYHHYCIHSCYCFEKHKRLLLESIRKDRRRPNR